MMTDRRKWPSCMDADASAKRDCLRSFAKTSGLCFTRLAIGQIPSSFPNFRRLWQLFPAKAVLIAIYEDDDTMVIPHGETMIRAGQHILAFADEDSMKELNRVFGSGE